MKGLTLMMWLFNRIALCLCFLLFYAFLSGSYSFADEFGILLVSSEARVAGIFCDNVYIGETPVELKKIQSGKHLIAAKVEDSIIFKETVKVQAGKTTSIIIPEGEPVLEGGTIENAGLFKKHNENGTSLLLGYSITNLKYRTTSSGVTVGLGYDFKLLDLRFRSGIEGTLGNNGYVLPVTLTFLHGFADDSQYLGVGAGVFFTDLAGSTPTGWRAIYGNGGFNKDNPFQFELIEDFIFADNVSMMRVTFALGYRWGG